MDAATLMQLGVEDFKRYSFLLDADMDMDSEPTTDLDFTIRMDEAAEKSQQVELDSMYLGSDESSEWLCSNPCPNVQSCATNLHKSSLLGPWSHLNGTPTPKKSDDPLFATAHTDEKNDKDVAMSMCDIMDYQQLFGGNPYADEEQRNALDSLDALDALAEDCTGAGAVDAEFTSKMMELSINCEKRTSVGPLGKKQLWKESSNPAGRWYQPASMKSMLGALGPSKNEYRL